MSESPSSSGHHPHEIVRKNSFLSFGKVAPSGVKNIDKIKQKSSQNLHAEEFHYKPKVSQSFLQDWLDYPVDRKVNVVWNSFIMWTVWLQWTNKGMAGLDPLDISIRARVCNQLQILGTAASLFLVIAVASFLVPPAPKHDDDVLLVNVFGVLMLTASVSLILYIALALTAIYPLIESLRDDIAFDAFENYQRRMGGKETYLFFAGMLLVLVALLVAAKILYADISVYIMIVITLAIVGFCQYLGTLVFLSLDPISSMHLGLSNDKDEHYRAELLSHFILRKIPNTLIADGETGKEFFERGRESVKLEFTRASQKVMSKQPVRSVKASSHYQSHYSTHSSGSAHHSVAEEEEDDDDDVGFGSMDSFETTSNGNSQPRNNTTALGRNTGSVSDGRDQDTTTDADGDGTGTVTSFSAPVTRATEPQGSVKQTRTQLVEAARAEVANKYASQKGPQFSNKNALPSLQDMFCRPDRYVLKGSGLSLADSIAVHACITQVGCVTTEQFISFLKESKQHRPCTCSHGSNADAGTASHADQCSSRRAGVWTDALTKIGVTNYFHAVQVIKALRPHL